MPSSRASANSQNLKPSIISLSIEAAFIAELIRIRRRDLQLKFFKERLARRRPLAGLTIAWNVSTEFYRKLRLLIAHFILNDFVYLRSGGVIETRS